MFDFLRSASTPPSDLLGIIRYVRARWRARLAVKGAVRAFAVNVGVFFALAYLMQWSRFTPSSILFARLALAASIVGSVYFFLVKPLIGECGRAYAAAILKPTAAALAMGGILLLLQSTHGGLAPALELVFLVTSGIGIYFLLVRVIDRTMLYEFRTVLLGTAG